MKDCHRVLIRQYDVFVVERSANNEDVILAYQNAVTVLHPSYHKVRAAVPDEMLARIDQAFKKVSQAFSVLTNSAQRGEYDGRNNSLLSYSTMPLELPKLPQTPADAPNPKEPKSTASADNHSKTRGSDTRHARSEAVQINVSPQMRPVLTRSSARAGFAQTPRLA